MPVGVRISYYLVARGVVGCAPPSALPRLRALDCFPHPPVFRTLPAGNAALTWRHVVVNLTTVTALAADTFFDAGVLLLPPPDILLYLLPLLPPRARAACLLLNASPARWSVRSRPHVCIAFALFMVLFMQRGIVPPRIHATRTCYFHHTLPPRCHHTVVVPYITFTTPPHHTLRSITVTRLLIIYRMVGVWLVGL